ncbi:hypothetical protein PG301_33720 [Parageobacillus sp. G301]|jgi:C4-dicarboxylate transporter|nr:hypothetical protein PG301_33720 [Parageobacillus sp. G301]
MKYVLLIAATIAYFIYRNQSPQNFIFIAIIALLLISVFNSKGKQK